MSETKEQIRTELINELIEWNSKIKEPIHPTAIFLKLDSMLPPETPEKIAEKKAVEVIMGRGDKGEFFSRSEVKQMLIEALLTDINK